MLPAPGLPLAPTVLTILGSVTAAVLAALLFAYFARRREPDQWFWQKRMEVYEDVLAKARHLLKDASEQESNPRAEEGRPLPTEGGDEQELTARLGIYGSKAVREQWSALVEKWEEHGRIGTSRSRDGDASLVVRGWEAKTELDELYVGLLLAAQWDARVRPKRPRGHDRPTNREVTLGRIGPERLRGGAHIVDNDGVSVVLRRKARPVRTTEE